MPRLYHPTLAAFHDVDSERVAARYRTRGWVDADTVATAPHDVHGGNADQTTGDDGDDGSDEPDDTDDAE